MEEQIRKYNFIWKVCSCLLISFIVLVRLCIAAEDPDKFPSKPITMIVQFAPGGNTDLTGRALATLASKILGQPIVVENKAGGAGVIGINALAKAAPDGYTIGTPSFSATVVTPHLRSVPYNVKQDFTWIMQYAEFPQPFCVLMDSRWKTFKEFIEEARKNPGKLTYATLGALSGSHIMMEQVAHIEDVKIIHVPTSGGAETVTKVLGGHVDSCLAAEIAPQIRSGKVRALGVASAKRMELIPNVPTFFELGYKVECPLWLGIAAPKGLDSRIVNKLHDAFKKASEDPSFSGLCNTLAMTEIYKGPEAFKEMVMKDFDSQANILRKLDFIK